MDVMVDRCLIPPEYLEEKEVLQEKMQELMKRQRQLSEKIQKDEEEIEELKSKIEVGEKADNVVREFKRKDSMEKNK